MRSPVTLLIWVKFLYDSASRLVEMDRNAVGERPEPKYGLRAYFEPLKRLKDINCLSGKARR